jgi:hypothetical protein
MVTPKSLPEAALPALAASIPATSSLDPARLSFCSFFLALLTPGNVSNRVRDHLSTCDEFSLFFAHPNKCQEYSRTERFAVWTLVLLGKYIAADLLAESDAVNNNESYIISVFAAELVNALTFSWLVKFIFSMGLRDASCWRMFMKYVAHFIALAWYLFVIMILVILVFVDVQVQNTHQCHGSKNNTGTNSTGATTNVTAAGVESLDGVDSCPSAGQPFTLFLFQWFLGSIATFFKCFLVGSPLHFWLGSCNCIWLQWLVGKIFLPEWARTNDMYKQVLRQREPNDLWFVTCCGISYSPEPPLSLQQRSHPELQGSNGVATISLATSV